MIKKKKKNRKRTNPFSPPTRAICGINASLPYGDTQIASSSLGRGPPLFGKVSVFTLKKHSPRSERPRSPESRGGASERGAKGRKKKNISLDIKCRYYSCGVLKCTPRGPAVCALAGGLSWSQLHFQPVEESGVLRRQRAAVG